MVNCGVIELSLIDHFLTFLTIKKPCTKYEKVTFTCRSLKTLDEQVLEDKLNEIDLSEYYMS